MKKLSFYLLLVLCLFITGCGEEKIKTVATLDEFENVSTTAGLTVSDNSDRYISASYILGAKLAVYEGVEIEMIEYSDSDSASTVQESHIESFNLLKSTGAYAEKEKGSNYYRYALVSNGRYMISTRVDNTLIFCKTLLENRDIVEEIINTLGY